MILTSKTYTMNSDQASILTVNSLGVVQQLPQRAIWKSRHPVTFDDSLPVLQNWIIECETDHKYSTLEPQPLPKRLLCISNSGPQVSVRLMERDSESPSNRRGFYMALSYCWGSSSGFCTIRKNYGEHLRSIPIGQLPKTVFDAVEVARRLGFSYL
ncbi:hypothetical protein BDV26DRAFT_35047 [Aspergillus bertholletiae]|uniref:Heterokaryon incompatibility domain-containing protein n=1 Tax=Aspergillus bertholletiae TaxID=1226010 RepID=A0A5N7AZB4_9EURO|nr:hypothetical protein BDV26DRAFT_35047 [Aspergillus bertholletiae]